MKLRTDDEPETISALTDRLLDRLGDQLCTGGSPHPHEALRRRPRRTITHHQRGDHHDDPLHH